MKLVNIQIVMLVEDDTPMNNICDVQFQLSDTYSIATYDIKQKPADDMDMFLFNTIKTKGQN